MAPNARPGVSAAGLGITLLRHLAVMDRPQLFDHRVVVGVRQAESGTRGWPLASYAQRALEKFDALQQRVAAGVPAVRVNAESPSPILGDYPVKTALTGTTGSPPRCPHGAAPKVAEAPSACWRSGGTGWGGRSAIVDTEPVGNAGQRHVRCWRTRRAGHPTAALTSREINGRFTASCHQKWDGFK